MAILLMLQARDHLTARELAERLEVSERTIYRDIESLSTAGVPVYGQAGHRGGFRLLDGYRTRLTGLTGQEAEALFLTGLPAAAADLGLGTAVAAAEVKLAATLPEQVRDRGEQLRRRFHVDTSSWYQDGDPVPHLPEMARAVRLQRRVRVRYLRWEQPHEVERTVEPYGLVLKGGRWYAVVRKHGVFRTYRVSRVVDLTVLEEEFERHEDFDLPSYWRTYIADFDVRRHRGRVVVRLSPTGVERLSHLEDAVTVQALLGSSTAEPDGWTRVELPVESDEQAISDLLRLGPDAVIVAPERLRARMATVLTAAAARYAG
ncbi:Predicted DNA-binding transcriptional regulator YafY, contains an HTH and WYL domains [Sinosporangium album]|uniref:Predicted DNA-binding transcriptional regulator YafY, contains an HTH and WYL domains n=2 Tax=Sinosporangium album TaxID=504805 RepID=A0A1G8G978_9ACTN|nr:Predicted DNA-binding transcriptional regulator YafY, contains an HTH and WYL domains [Sinosporangium album]